MTAQRGLNCPLCGERVPADVLEAESWDEDAIELESIGKFIKLDPADLYAHLWSHNEADRAAHAEKDGA